MRQRLEVADIFRRHGDAESHPRLIELLLNKPREQAQYEQEHSMPDQKLMVFKLILAASKTRTNSR